MSNLELRLHLPSVAAGDRVFMTVTDVFSINVSTASVYSYHALKSYLTYVNYPVGHGELQRAQWCSTAEGQTGRCAPPSSWRHDAGWHVGKGLNCHRAAGEHCKSKDVNMAHVYMFSCVELQQVMVHRGRVPSQAASERKGCHHSGQPQSSWWFFQKCE